MKPTLFIVLLAWTTPVFAGLEARLGVPLGVTANPDCSFSSGAMGQADALGSLDAIIFQWSEAQNLRAVIEARVLEGRANGLGVVLGLAVTQLAGLRTELELPSWVAADCGLTTGTVTFANPCLRAHLIADAADYAALLRPEYFHVGTEVNTLRLRLVLVSPLDTEFSSFATLYQEVAAAVKAASPGTKVFTSFLYELEVQIESDTPGQWNADLDIFRGPSPGSLLDLVGYTTYPSSNGFLTPRRFNAPGDIPIDYYEPASLHLRAGEQAVFTETGWPTGGDGTEAEQKQFVERLPALMRNADPAFIVWALLHDVPSSVFPDANLATVGLRRCDGTPKPAWATFLGVSSGDLTQGHVRVGSTGGQGVVHPGRGEKAEIQVTPTGAGNIRLRVFTLSGEEVKDLSFASDGPADPNNVRQWDVRNEKGNFVASGVYWVHVEGPGLDQRKKVIVLK